MRFVASRREQAKEEYEKAGGSTKFKFIACPPRPPTAYFIFLGTFREEYKAKNPDMKVRCCESFLPCGPRADSAFASFVPCAGARV